MAKRQLHLAVSCGVLKALQSWTPERLQGDKCVLSDIEMHLMLHIKTFSALFSIEVVQQTSVHKIDKPCT